MANKVRSSAGALPTVNSMHPPRRGQTLSSTSPAPRLPGGALPRMLLPFKFGVGGRFGSGRQWMSWLTLDEAVGIVKFALASSALSGPVNAVTPHPVQNIDFTHILARALHRPALFPAPA